MKFSTFLASTMLFAGGVALANLPDTKTYEAILDPPVGTMRCGFTLSGTVKSPQHNAVSSGFFFKSEVNIVTPLDRRHATHPHLFDGPGEIRVTASSKDFSDDSLFQKRNRIQVQLRVWNFYSLPPGSDASVPQIPTLAESPWVDVPVTSPTCASMKPMPDLSPTTGTSVAPSTSVAPAPNSSTTIKRQTTQQPKP